MLYYGITPEIKPMFNISNSETSFVYSKSCLWEVLYHFITESYVCEEKYYYFGGYLFNLGLTHGSSKI
jgi:hypothetical protein